MIERVIELSIRHRVLVILAGVLLAVWGVFAVYHTPMDAVPDLSENQVLVYAEWPGHGPREVEDQITYPLSRALQGLAGVRVVRGSSDVNYSLIHVIFHDHVTFTAGRDRVQERIAVLSDTLPAGVAPRLAPEAIPTGQIFWYTVEGAGYDLARLREVQDWFVKPQLEAVSGVAEVASVGGQVREYRVALDPHKIRGYGVDPADVLREISRANAAVGGNVVQQGRAEFIVRGVGWLGAGANDTDTPDPQIALRDLERILIPTAGGDWLPLSDVAVVSLGARPRRGILEKDGNEVTGGVVLMRVGENPLEITQRLKRKVQELQSGLPAGVRVVPCYDRTPLIEGAVRTVTATVIEAIVTATVCVVLVLLHLRTSFIIAVTLPLAALTSFAIMWTLRQLGVADIQTNIMSLAGIAISIGVLVDSSIVIAENVMFHLREKFGDRPVTGDIREIVLPACRTVGRPIFFSVLIMLVSFLPVFALGGIDGKMYRPLAFTKTFAFLSVAILAVTLVPALCTYFVKGRLRRETESWLVRNVIEVYRPVLNYLLDHPGALAWVLSLTFIVGLAPLGSRGILLAALFGGMLITGGTLRSRWTAAAGVLSLVAVALVAESTISPLQTELRMPLDEGMVMDMPITIPRASNVQSGDDLKARDMLLCRFPEVEMVVGKAGRAESPFDPAPLDMIETMIMFRPREFWPKRRLLPDDARRQGEAALAGLIATNLIDSPSDDAARRDLLDQALMAAMPRFDAVLREFAYQRNQEFSRDLRGEMVRYLVERTAALVSGQGKLLRPVGPGEVALIAGGAAHHAAEHLAMSLPEEDLAAIAKHAAKELESQGLVESAEDALRYDPPLAARPLVAVGEWLGKTPPTLVSQLRESGEAHRRNLWADHTDRLNRDLLDRAAKSYTRIICEELLARSNLADERLIEVLDQAARLRELPQPGNTTATKSEKPKLAAKATHHGSARGPLPVIDPHPAFDKLLADLSGNFADRLLLWPRDREELAGSYGGELDTALQMPGWTNVWTRPIQNRVDMLATGINTEVGVRVLGRSLDDVVNASEEIAAVLRDVPGAADVIADPIRGKGYLEIRPDREQAAALGVSVGDIHDLIETALGGRIATQTVEGRARFAVRVQFLPDFTGDIENVKRLPVRRRGKEPQSLAALGGNPVSHSASPFAGQRGAGGGSRAEYVPLESVASVRIVEGPATIKSENGQLRNYVRLNVRNRNVLEFLDEARRTVGQSVALPEGTSIEWTGQFEHTLQTANMLALLVPIVVGTIFLLLWITYRDLADALLMLLAVPGAVVGGLFFQWLFGFRFSVAVGVGYIACFGMAAATGMIMLVYLREAVERAGGLAAISAEGLRQAVMDGAVHRLRPKLLTEATTILGLAPMLWATGVGAEVIRPMAAPVLGGILIADEVIDLLLPLLFYKIRLRRWQKLNGDP